MDLTIPTVTFNLAEIPLLMDLLVGGCISGTAGFLFLTRKSNKKKNAGAEMVPETEEPPVVEDLWGFKSKTSLRGSQENSQQPGEEVAHTALAGKEEDSGGLLLEQDVSDPFMSSLWHSAVEKPYFEKDPFRALSGVLHAETRSMYRDLSRRENWSLAEQACLQSLQDRLNNPRPPSLERKQYYTCPQETLGNPHFDRMDSWTLASALLGTMGQDKSVATSLSVDVRLGHLIFGSMELGLAQMKRTVEASADVGTHENKPKRTYEIDAELWPNRRLEGIKRVHNYQMAASEQNDAEMQRCFLRVLQESESIWELNQRGSVLLTKFRDGVQKLYQQTDAAVISLLADRFSVSEEELRFAENSDPFKTVEMETGRFVTFQIRAKPGEHIPHCAEDRPEIVKLREVQAGEVAWRDLPASEVRPVYEETLYRKARVAEFQPEHTPESFAFAMGQIFGDRLPAEYLRKYPQEIPG